MMFIRRTGRSAKDEESREPGNKNGVYSLYMCDNVLEIFLFF